MTCSNRAEGGHRPLEDDVDRLCMQVAGVLRACPRRPAVPHAGSQPGRTAPRPRSGCATKGTRPAPCFRLVYRLAERDLHQRVETTGRLVEDQQVGTRRERVHQLDLLAVAFRQRPHLLRRFNMETVEEHARYAMSTSPCTRPRKSSVSSVVSDGHSAGSPATYATRRCAATGSRHASMPNNVADPAVGRCRPSKQRIVVVLPEPFGPRNP